MKKIYENPKAQCVALSVVDVIQTSAIVMEEVELRPHQSGEITFHS